MSRNSTHINLYKLRSETVCGYHWTVFSGGRGSYSFTTIRTVFYLPAALERTYFITYLPKLNTTCSVSCLIALHAIRTTGTMTVILGRTLFVLLFIFRVSQSAYIHSTPYTRFHSRKVDNSQSSSTVHNATIDCGDWTFLYETTSHCQGDLKQLANYGYPWSTYASHKKSKNNPNLTDRVNIRQALGDALDSLNHVCHIHDRSRTCLDESGIPGYCATSLDGASLGLSLQIDFQFICHHQRRDENLVRSLQCLYATRLLAMLYFHIADRCRGVGILDDVMTRYKNAYFYTLDIKPIWLETAVPVLYCLPTSVISTCIKDVIAENCGTVTADFVQNYLFFTQEWFDHILRSAGIKLNICEYNISSDMVVSRPLIPTKGIGGPLGTVSVHPKHRISISRLLESTAPGTALNTVFGKYVLHILHSLSGEELCTTENAYAAYLACVLSSDDNSETSKFNIIQFAHQIAGPLSHGTQCNRLEQFTECWNLLQEICGPKIRGFKQHATLMVESCKIQSEMTTAGCHWQDMLLPYYIQSSRVTVWPTAAQCLVNPMSLDDVHYTRFNSVINDLDTVISFLQPALKDISKKCGSQYAERVRLLLNKLHYLQGDALKYTFSFTDGLLPTN